MFILVLILLLILLLLLLCIVPDHCSHTLKHIIEALLITHTETKLNKLGHLDGNVPLTMNNDIDRGNWCHNLVRRPILSSSTLSTSMTN